MERPLPTHSQGGAHFRISPALPPRTGLGGRHTRSGRRTGESVQWPSSCTLSRNPPTPLWGHQAWETGLPCPFPLPLRPASTDSRGGWTTTNQIALNYAVSRFGLSSHSEKIKVSCCWRPSHSRKIRVLEECGQASYSTKTRIWSLWGASCAWRPSACGPGASQAGDPRSREAEAAPGSPLDHLSQSEDGSRAATPGARRARLACAAGAPELLLLPPLERAQRSWRCRNATAGNVTHTVPEQTLGRSHIQWTQMMVTPFTTPDRVPRGARSARPSPPAGAPLVMFELGA